MSTLLLLALLGSLTSQSAMDFFVYLAVLVLMIQAARSKGPKNWKLFEKNGLEGLWIAWVLVVSLGFILNNVAYESLLKRLLESSWILVLYFLVSAFRYVELTIEKASKVLLVLGMLVSVMAIGIFLFKNEERVGGTFNNPMTTAHSYSLVFLVLTGIFFSRFRQIWQQNRNEFYLWVICLLLNGALLVLTMTRGVWIAIALGVVSMAALLSWRLFGLALGMLATVVGLMYLCWEKFRERLLFAFDYKNNYDSERLVLWKTNWIIFKDHPWFGVGYGENSKLLPEYYERQGLPADQFASHAHNQILHLLAGTGVLGTLCYLVLFSYCIYISVGMYKTDKDSFERAFCLGAFGALVGFLLGGLTESNFEHAKVRTLLVFLLAVILYIYKKNKSKSFE